MGLIANIALSAFIISLCAWLAQSNPRLAGFVVALPISTLIVLVLTHLQSQGEDTAVQLAQSIFLALPLTLAFFVPFLLAPYLKLGFWASYISGVALLASAYLAHSYLFRKWF